MYWRREENNKPTSDLRAPISGASDGPSCAIRHPDWAWMQVPLTLWDRNTSKVSARLRQGNCLPNGSSWATHDLQDHSKPLIMNLINSYQYYSLFIIHEQLKWVTGTCISNSNSHQCWQLWERITERGQVQSAAVSSVFSPDYCKRQRTYFQSQILHLDQSVKQLLMDVFMISRHPAVLLAPAASWQWIWQFSCALHDKVLPPASVCCLGISLDVINFHTSIHS